MNKIFKPIAIILILIMGAFIVTILSIGSIRSQIMEKAGLAVAQTPTQWNNVKDAAAGANQTSGLLDTVPFMNVDGAGGNYTAIIGNRTQGTFVYLTGAAVNLSFVAGGNIPVYTTLSNVISHNQVEVSTGAGGNLIAAANINRKSIMIRNQGATDMYVGNTGVTTATGFVIRASEVFVLDRTTAAIYGITAAANTIVAFLEE